MYYMYIFNICILESLYYVYFIFFLIIFNIWIFTFCTSFFTFHSKNSSMVNTINTPTTLSFFIMSFREGRKEGSYSRSGRGVQTSVINNIIYQLDWQKNLPHSNRTISIFSISAMCCNMPLKKSSFWTAKDGLIELKCHVWNCVWVSDRWCLLFPPLGPCVNTKQAHTNPCFSVWDWDLSCGWGQL